MNNLVCKSLNVVKQVKESLSKISKDERGEASMIGIVLGVVLVVVLFAFIAMPQSRALLNEMYNDLITWYNGLNIFPTS